MTKIFLKEDTKNHKYHGYYVVDREKDEKK